MLHQCNLCQKTLEHSWVKIPTKQELPTLEKVYFCEDEKCPNSDVNHLYFVNSELCLV
jgi:hypothetical protein